MVVTEEAAKAGEAGGAAKKIADDATECTTQEGSKQATQEALEKARILVTLEVTL